MSTVKPKKITKQPETGDVVVSVAPVFEEKPAVTQDIVTVKVLIGTLVWEKGHFEKGDTFTCTLKELQKFDPHDIEVIG